MNLGSARARVLIAAPRRNASEGEKSAMARAPSPAREARALPRHLDAIALSVGSDKFRVQRNSTYAFTIFFRRQDALVRAIRSNANRGYSCCRAKFLTSALCQSVFSRKRPALSPSSL